MKSIFKSSRGSALIYTLIAMSFFIIMIAFVVDVGEIYVTKVKARHSLNLALRAASSQLDLDKLADPITPETFIIEADARDTFDEILRKNLKLDNSNNPLAGSFAEGTVTLEDFKVYNLPDLPAVYSYGATYTEQINEVSVTAVIKVPIKLSGFAKVAHDVDVNQELYIHSTVGPELIPVP